MGDPFHICGEGWDSLRSDPFDIYVEIWDSLWGNQPISYLWGKKGQPKG